MGDTISKDLSVAGLGRFAIARTGAGGEEDEEREESKEERRGRERLDHLALSPPLSFSCRFQHHNRASASLTSKRDRLAYTYRTRIHDP